MLTTCPDCQTTFRIGQAHLDARQGLVRCGGCGAVFNAYDSLLPDFEAPPPGEGEAPGGRPSPGDGDRPTEVDLTSPLPSPTGPVTGPARAWQEASRQAGMAEAPARTPGEPWAWEPPAGPEADSAGDVVDLSAAAQAPPPEPEASPPSEAESSDAILLSDLPNRRKRTTPRLAWRGIAYGLLSALLTMLFVAQLAYFLRGEIVGRQPEWRPALEAACGALGCRVPLARDLDKVRIESSSLETDPEQPAQARLRINLVNRSNADQAWPHLLLKLTDDRNAPLAQRAFAPADYRPKGGAPAHGLGPMSEQEFSIDLDLAAVQAAGYEVKLHYP
jgi:predicted Zn finger-like uncharacterized protein